MRYTIALLLLFNLLFAKINSYQMNIIKVVYNTCKQYHADDGFTFENTCVAIALTESSAGKNLIGDQGSHPEILVNSSLGVMQVRVRTALEVFKNFPKLRNKYHGFWHKNISAIDKYVPLLKRMTYYKMRANRALKKHRYKDYRYWNKKYLKNKKMFSKYRKAYYKDLRIAETLLSDVKFNTIIAAHYLILNYQIAKQRKLWNPWWKTISRYNGGWDNKVYVHRVLNKMKTVRWLKRKRLLGSGK